MKSTREQRVARYLSEEADAREALASLPESIRARLERWQEGQGEWFSYPLLEIVAEFIAFEDAAESDSSQPR